FIQIAAPTRNRILQYQEYEGRVRAMAAGINERFAGAPHPPIVLLVEHHQPHTIYEYYRAAEVCVVSSLHDGMNLVAKELVSSRDETNSFATRIMPSWRPELLRHPLHTTPDASVGRRPPQRMNRAATRFGAGARLLSWW